jgi:hypothetical protein
MSDLCSDIDSNNESRALIYQYVSWNVVKYSAINKREAIPTNGL